MIRPPSIIRRLTASLALVGGFGAVLLLIVIGIEYRISFSNLSDHDAFRRALRELSEHVLLPMAVLILPMAMAGRWAIRSGVRPLTDAAAQIDARASETRGVRVDTTDIPVEARPFADAINRVLGRIDGAAALHEAFAADIAHELRTPLTLLSLELDRLDHPDAHRMRGDVAKMRRLIDQLMLLAQIDADQAAQVPPAQIDLGDVAGDVIAQLAPIALDAGRRLALEGESPVIVAGRREAIAAALRNLIENALRASPEGGCVTVRTAADGSVAVRDEGPGLSCERLAALTQRHRRADHASRDGAGLGLAIVERIMRAHGGRLEASQQAREIRLHFPDRRVSG
jgi:signal transduction histidine kinase